MSKPAKILAVVGATGTQGGGLARAALRDPKRLFKVRALTRNPDSDKAKQLEERGAEIVAADLDDLDSIKRAFEGADLAFCVTNFWEHFSPERELEQARNMAEAAAHAGVDHVIWSTLEDTRLRVPLDDARLPTLMGQYKVPHFDVKGQANSEFIDRDVPTTLLLTSYYWDNLLQPGSGPARGADGKLTLTLPMMDKKLPGIAAADIGKCAYGIFHAGKRYIGKTVGIAGEHLTGKHMAARLGDALGEPVIYNAMPASDYRALGFPGAEDLGNMYEYKSLFNREFCRARNITVSRSLNPALLSFRAWLKHNASKIDVESAAA